MAYEARNRPEGPPVLSLAGAGRFGLADAAEPPCRLAISLWTRAGQVTSRRWRGTSRRRLGARRAGATLPSGTEVAQRPTASAASFLCLLFLVISSYLNLVRDEIQSFFGYSSPTGGRVLWFFFLNLSYLFLLT